MSGLGHAITTSGASILNLLVRVVGLSVLARLLQPEAFGWIAITLVVAAIISDIAQFDLRDALIRRGRIWRQQIVGATIILVISALAWTGIAVAARDIVSNWFGMPEISSLLLVMAVIILFNALAVVPEAMLIRGKKVGQVAIADVLSYALFFTPIAIWLASNGWNEWSLATAYVARSAGYGLMMAGLAVNAGSLKMPPLRGVSLSLLLKSLFQNAAFGTANRVLTQGSRNIDNLVVGTFLGAADLGVYTRAYSLAATPIDALLGMTIRSALFPAFARVQNHAQKLAGAVNRAISGALLIMVPISAAAVGLAPSLVPVVLGPKWTGAILPFQCIMAAMALRFAPRMAAALARATGHVWMAFAANLASTCLLALLVGLGLQGGLPGAGLGFLGAALFEWGLSLVVLGRLSGQGIRKILSLHIPHIAIGLLVGAVFFAAEQFGQMGHLNPFVNLITSALVGAAVTAVCVLGLPGLFMDRAGRQLLMVILQTALGRVSPLKPVLGFVCARLST